MSADAKSLKRLGFVHTGTNLAYSEAEKLYKTVRSYAPLFVAPSLEKVEDSLVATVAPIVVKAQDLGDKLLQFADDKVDHIVSTADQRISLGRSGVSSGIKSVKDLHETNMKTFGTAMENYFNFMSKAADYAVEKLNVKGVQAATVKGVQAARDTLHAAVQKAREATDPDVAVHMAWEAWTNFTAIPQVAKLVDTAEPATKMGLQAFHRLHDTLVVNQIYKKVVDGTAGTINYAATTTPYKLGALYLYPFVQTVADPAISKVTQSKVVNKVVDYWKPASIVAAH